MPAASPANPLECKNGQRRGEIVQSLLGDVFRGRLQAGQRLVTQQMAERFGVSHTPIREAFISLAGIGIIDLVPNRGAVVRKITARSVQEISLVRRALECEAVRRACGQVTEDELDLLRQDLASLRRATSSQKARFVQQARDVDSRLHDVIAESSGNVFLAGELSRLKLLFRAFRDVAWQHDLGHTDVQRLIEETDEHAAIVEALASGDRREAGRAMSRHILAGAKYWSRALVQNNGAHNNGSRKK